MRRCLTAAAFVFAFVFSLSAGAAADDQSACNDRGAHRPEIVAACDRAIASGAFGDADLGTLYLSRAQYWALEHSAEKAYADNSAALQAQPDDIEILDRAFTSAVAAGKVDEASVLATRMLARNKNYPVAHLVLGVQALKSSNYADAQVHIRQSAKGPVTDLVATLLSAWTSEGAGDSKVAIATIDRLNGAPWYATFKDLHAGLILELSGRDRDAGARFERDLKFDDSMLRVTEAYAHWLSRNNDRDKAVAIYEAFDRKLARHPLVQEGLRRLKADDKLPPLVETPLSGAAEALYGIGAALTQRGGAELALIYTQLALYLQPNHALAQLALADAYEVVKAPQYAIQIYRLFPPVSPFWRNVQIRMAIDIDAAGGDEAIDILRPIIADDPKDLDAIMALGNIERGHRKYADCTQTFSKGIDRLPSGNDKLASVWYFYRGICEERASQWPRAEIDLRKAIELQPDDPNVLNYLGYWLLEKGLKTEEAVSLIRHAVQLKPDDGYVVDSLGWVDYRMGNLPDAEKFVKRAIELKPDDPIIRRHMGDIFWRLDRKADARLEWAEARKLNPEPDESAEIESRLRDGLPEGETRPSAAQTAGTEMMQLASALQADATASVAAKAVVPSGRRIALVIGNSGYRSVPALANPRRDSRAMADVLRKVGFQSVTLVNDMTRDRMVEAIRAFAIEADRADWAMIYYAGHGIEVGGLNYLIPVDAKLASDRDVQFESIALDQIMAAVEGASKLRLVILDACRDNPFADVMRRTTAMRSVGHGLGQVEPDAGMLVVFAAKHGQIVFDGDGQNSPFVSSFVKRVSTPQIEIRKLFDLVRDDVMAATRRQQQPFTYGSVSGSEDFYFLTNEASGKVN